MFKKISIFWDEFKETGFYKIVISPLINLCFTTLGNTVGIWLSYVIITKLLFNIWNDLQWPGIDSFILDGSILLISFSFLTSALYASTRRLKINFFNVLCILIMLANVGSYLRVIFLKHKYIQKAFIDTYTSTTSKLIFFSSIILLYIVLVREKYVENNSDPEKFRTDSLDLLKAKFQKTK